jgi:quinol monooxygenase YgiN
MKKNKSDLIVTASAKAKPGKENELEQALPEVAGPAREQPGCVSFSFYQYADDHAAIIGLERWASTHEHDQHLSRPHVQNGRHPRRTAKYSFLHDQG